MTTHGLLPLPPTLLDSSKACGPFLYSLMPKPSMPLSLQRSPIACWYLGLGSRKKNGQEATGKEDPPHSPYSYYRGHDGAKTCWGSQEEAQKPFSLPELPNPKSRWFPFDGKGQEKKPRTYHVWAKGNVMWFTALVCDLVTFAYNHICIGSHTYTSKELPDSEATVSYRDSQRRSK